MDIKTLPKKSWLYNTLRNIKRLFNFLILPDSAAILSSRFSAVRNSICAHAKDARLILDVGSGTRPVSQFQKVITMDFDPLCKVDILGDAHCIPFDENSFDLVWLGGVLEHVSQPHKVVEEAHRVIRKGGYIYIEVPFFQRVHDAPHDFQRFTLDGLRELCSQFTEIKRGVLAGPSSAFAHILRNYLALCLSLNCRALYHVWYYYILGWVTLPIKFLDLLLVKHRQAETTAFAFYYFGEKT